MHKNRVAAPRLSTIRILVPWLIGALTLAGCAINPQQEEAKLLAPIAGAELSRAGALESKGEASAAAEVYLELAKGARPPAREQLQIKAARAYLSAGKTAEARRVINDISRASLTPAQGQILLLIEADLALLAGRPNEAISGLERMRPSTLPKELKAERLGTLAAAHRMSNDPIAAAEALNELDSLLSDPDARLQNQVSLISTLAVLPPGQLRDLARGGRGSMKGWADVALLAQSYGADPRKLESSYRSWRGSGLGHPALPELARAYTASLSGGYSAGDAVTVMLPRGGRFADAANAVRDGIQAASRADTSGGRPTIDQADSTNAGSVAALHRRAVASGADYVIGPLQKPAVDTLAAEPSLAVPTLALNEGTRAGKPPANLFQYSLSPDNEATEVASKAAALGYKRALVLYPEGDWGSRLTSAFSGQWRKLGGTVVGQSAYNPGYSSYEKSVSDLLARGQADFVFLVATDDLASKIYPQVKLASSGSLPVISTSHVYSGSFDPARDQALVGLYFVDIPWMLGVGGDGPLSRRGLSGTSAYLSGPLARLYAMGIDAYRLAPRVSELASRPGAFYPGQTGGLWIDPVGRVQRQLTLGRFTNTGPRPADDLGSDGKGKDSDR